MIVSKWLGIGIVEMREKCEPPPEGGDAVRVFEATSRAS